MHIKASKAHLLHGIAWCAILGTRSTTLPDHLARDTHCQAPSASVATLPAGVA